MRDNDADGGRLAQTILAHVLAAVEARELELGRLDAAAGDGDHGAGMVRGLRAAVAAADGPEGVAGDILARAGTGFTDAAGGASGALVGSWIGAIGRSLAGADRLDVAAVADALAAGQAMIQRLGKAKPGDKTMLDTLDPFLRALRRAVETGATLDAAWAAALPEAEAGMRATAEMIAKRGRAARLGERSRGHVDAGAMSLLIILTAVGDVIRQQAA